MQDAATSAAEAEQVTNTVEFPVMMNARADALGRNPVFQGWYPEARIGSVVMRIQNGWPHNGSPSCPIGIIHPDDSWELRSPGEMVVLAAGRNYAWTTQGFPTPELARKIQDKRPGGARSPKKAPKPKECFRCGSIARTQPVGVRADDGAVKTIHACPQHLAEAFAESKPKQESPDAHVDQPDP